MTARRYRLDHHAERHGAVLIGGSPLKLFRMTAQGVAELDRLGTGEPLAESALVARLIDAGAIHPTPGAGPHRFAPADVTVVVPTLGPPPHPPVDAVVVDDGSDPPVSGAAIRLRANRGPAAARNAGLAAVTTPLVAFVDADVTVPADWLARLVAHFDDDRVALVAPRVVTPRSGAPTASYDAEHGPLDLGAEPARVRAGTRVSYVPAAAIVARTDAVRAVGGFDPALRFGEDVDLVWRLDDAGWRVRYEPSVVVEHAARPTWSAWVRQRIGYGSSAAPLASRHRGALAPVRLSGWSVGAWLAAATGHPVAGAGVSAGTGIALARKLRDVPTRVAFGLAWRGNLHAGDQLARAVRRCWWPLLAVGATRSRTARRVLLASFVAARRPLVAADDVAYSLGVWTGMWRHRTVAPIVPSITSWP